MKLKDKVIVITGSTRGIGRAIAEECAREGARVVISSRDESAVRQTVETINQNDDQATGIAADVSLPDELEQLLQHAIDTWGGVDVWINNAGLSGGYRPISDMDPDEISDIVDVNLKGTMQACRIVLPHFVERGGGLLLNVSGKGGRGDASPFLSVYSATKAAVVNLTRSLAKEYKGYPVSIHSVLPGMVATDFYKDVKTSPRTEKGARSVPYVLKAIGVPLDEVGRFVAEIATQVPGEKTGNAYSVMKRRRLVKGIALLTFYRAIGKIRSD